MRPLYGLGLSIECYTGCRPWETPIRSLFYLFHMKKRKDWFKPKKYPHIGLPIEPKDRQNVECYVRNPQKIAHHSFMPLIRREQVSHRYRGQDGVTKRTTKRRPISYAAHLDAQIYSYYGQILEKRYEDYLEAHGYGECVIAYRSLARENGKGNKCNIDLAKDAFEHIRRVGDVAEQVVIIADIKSFFDTLNHKLLKIAWKEVCDFDSMPEDEYAVFKHVTRFAFVNAQDLFNVYRTRILCQQKTKVSERTLASMKYFRDKNAIAFCDKDSMADIRKCGMIHKNESGVGIPQGLPISAALANIYMWRFDRAIFDYLKSIGGYYRRYSDDIIIVCEGSKRDEVLLVLKDLIATEKLTIADEKTTVFSIKAEEERLKVIDEKTDQKSVIEYLGLSFDGEVIRLKNKSLSKYYHKMKRTINAKTHYAIKKTDKTGGVLFVRQLLRKFTPIGSKRHLIFRRCRFDKSQFCNTGVKSFGNFWTYAKKASKICNSPAISKQLRRNKPILRARILKAKHIISEARNRKRLAEFLKYGKVYH